VHGGHARRVRERIAAAGGEVFCVRADVSDPAAVRRMVEAVRDRWGGIDLLVNNAGIAHEALVLHTGEDDWDRVFECNLKGIFNCCKAVLPDMYDRKAGHVVCIGSLLGVYGAYGAAAYAASKAALIGMCKGLACEAGPYGVRINVVIPGFMETDMTRRVGEHVRERVRRESALGVFSDPAAVARFIVALDTVETASGQVFNLDSRCVRWV
jgi:3-oxoacyl-[acyl-carrier protein] reductase